MIEFESYASSSGGNLYVVTVGAADRQIKIMLECGLPMSEISKLPFRLSDIDSCFISHEHQDHARAVHDLLRHGVDLFMTKGTAEALNLKKFEYYPMVPGKGVFINGFNGVFVAAFKVHHDAKEPVGYVVIAPEPDNEVLVFAVDTYYIDFTFERIDIVAVECNHSYEILKKRVADGELDKVMADRIAKSHFALENVVDWLASCDLTSCREIWLLHMSDDNGNARVFSETVMSKTGIPVHVAERRWRK